MIIKCKNCNKEQAKLRLRNGFCKTCSLHNIELTGLNNDLIDSVAVVIGQDDILSNEVFENLITKVDDNEKKDT